MDKKTLPLKETALLLAFGTLAILMIGLAIIGGLQAYSPVPFWDMWDGYLGFFLNVADRDTGAWWFQHNEHRIFLARLLFWADIKWFGGASWFLIATNYLLVGVNVLVFWRMLRDAAATKAPAIAEVLLGLALTAWLFLWTQKENLTWAFQSQFILAQLLPLCALYWLHKSVAGPHANRQFLVACCFGLASVGTMANGMLALPLMMVYSLITRQGTARVCILACLSAVSLYFYLHGYKTPGHHGSLTQALKENPLGLVKYVLLYLGSPFYYLLGEGAYAWNLTFGLTYLSGFSLIGCSAWLAVKLSRQPCKATLTLALLFFILYIGGTAVGTAGGRLIFGEEQALSSRYTTPVLMAWSALFVIFSPAILSAIKKRGTKILLPFAALGMLMIPLQLQALHPQDDIKFTKKIAALALALQVKDPLHVKNVSPNIEKALAFAARASSKNISIFGMYPYLDAREQLGMAIQQPKLPVCLGGLDAVDTITGEDQFVRIHGWMFNPKDKTYPNVIRVLSDQGKIIGYALTGQSKPEIAGTVGSAARLSGYQGYLLKGQTGTSLTLQSDSPPCQMQVAVPMPLSNKTAEGPCPRCTGDSN
ncbi:MAG: hypothetical protein CTY16_07980 [Methylobacter sp.]|nr:MAG: hypothetical protein CTY16_07980 [Methylobacter sp.]